MIGWFLREREAHTLCTSAYAPPTQEALGRTSPAGTGSPLTSPTSCSQSGCRGGTCWWCLWQRWAQKQSVLFDNMIFLINGVWCFYSRGFVMQNRFHPKKTQWPKNVETSGLVFFSLQILVWMATQWQLQDKDTVALSCLPTHRTVQSFLLRFPPNFNTIVSKHTCEMHTPQIDYGVSKSHF